jgi:hypothetical protein
VFEAWKNLSDCGKTTMNLGVVNLARRVLLAEAASVWAAGSVARVTDSSRDCSWY